MDALRRLFGGEDESEQPGASTGRTGSGRRFAGASADERAIERYRYLLRTAPPETIEEAHAEAFAQLTPEQRRLVLAELSRELPERERAAAVRSDDDPRSLARMATRAELRQPGTLERSFTGIGGQGVGLGGLMAGSFLSTIAGVVVGSAIADAFFGDTGSDQRYADGAEAARADDANADYAADADTGDAGDFGSGDFGGGDFGDFGGDFGGGDFGGDF